MEPINLYNLPDEYFASGISEYTLDSPVISRAKSVQDEIEELRRQIIAVQCELDKMKKSFRCESLL